MGSMDAHPRRLRRLLSHLWSSKFTTFDTNGKLVGLSDFLLVNNSYLDPILYHLRAIADYWSNFHCREGCPLTQSSDVNPQNL